MALIVGLAVLSYSYELESHFRVSSVNVCFLTEESCHHFQSTFSTCLQECLHVVDNDHRFNSMLYTLDDLLNINFWNCFTYS